MGRPYLPEERGVAEVASNNLMRGTLDLLVLRALERKEAHGFAIARWIRSEGEDAVGFEDAALYQSLHRLERQGLVASSWGSSDNNRRARFYRLTSKGRTRLERDSAEFRSYAAAVMRLLGKDAAAADG